ncbi:TPA: hypothetical protein N0F65_002408 [Lagenidium giganteum]|uniref:SAP30-binding protein n=1 Tax=Lagenidium giganteum TaxID=4803 RepID=A0AAV2YLI3_9STRA|nr:TPA: hypothetical protein N0F65_002408 [Lagenidium giganteum]
MNALGLAAYHSSDDEDDDVNEGTAAPGAVDGTSHAAPVVVDAHAAPAAPVDAQMSAQVAPAAADVRPMAAVTPSSSPSPPSSSSNRGLQLPPEPVGPCDARVQARVAQFLSLPQSFMRNLQTKKEFANPSILDKVVDYYEIEEAGTNFDKDVFDPAALPAHEYVDVLSQEQRRRDEERMARQLQQQQQREIEFRRGGRL